jgi:hypothetical protein
MVMDFAQAFVTAAVPDRGLIERPALVEDIDGCLT